jgi:hypothetical protein
MKFIALTALLLTVVLSSVACARKSDSTRAIIVGGLYVTRENAAIYRVSKVLAVDKHAVHLRIYKNKFKDFPKDLDSSILSLGGVGDPDGFGIGHAPLAIDGFWQDAPVFLRKEPVRADELDGYKYYLGQMK